MVGYFLTKLRGLFYGIGFIGIANVLSYRKRYGGNINEGNWHPSCFWGHDISIN